MWPAKTSQHNLSVDQAGTYDMPAKKTHTLLYIWSPCFHSSLCCRSWCWDTSFKDRICLHFAYRIYQKHSGRGSPVTCLALLPEWRPTHSSDLEDILKTLSVGNFSLKTRNHIMHFPPMSSRHTPTFSLDPLLQRPPQPRKLRAVFFHVENHKVGLKCCKNHTY